MQRTLSIIKPDGVARNLTGEILRRFEQAGLRVAAIRKLQLSEAEVAAFYAVHRERPFFKDLITFMSSGPVVVAVLEGSDAIATNRELMGATNPAEAAPGTIRADFAESIDANTVHGSDSPETAAQEIAFFFSAREIL
jgi:nucleoside-diphosphate kinase